MRANGPVYSWDFISFLIIGVVKVVRDWKVRIQVKRSDRAVRRYYGPEDDRRPRTPAPAGHTPCIHPRQRMKPIFLFLRRGCAKLGSCSIGPTMPSSPMVGNLPWLFGPSSEGILVTGSLRRSAGRQERQRSTLVFHVASISAHFSSVRRYIFDVSP